MTALDHVGVGPLLKGHATHIKHQIKHCMHCTSNWRKALLKTARLCFRLPFGHSHSPQEQRLAAFTGRIPCREPLALSRSIGWIRVIEPPSVTTLQQQGGLPTGSKFLPSPNCGRPMSYSERAGSDGRKRLWLEEEIQEDLKWCVEVKEVLHSGASEFQTMELVSSGPFGKVLLLDGKVQSAEADEFVYHELLVHPAMLLHPNPKRVFICGGGEGATAREVLRHKSVEEVIMVDIDKDVCDFCNQHLEANQEAFANPKLKLIYDDAKAQLQQCQGTFDVIVADLADPVYGGPCYQLYTQDFYRDVVEPKLKPDGIFVTQSGPAGVLSSTEVFTAIYSTLHSVFPSVLPYAQHIPSYNDAWGFNMAVRNASMQLPDSALKLDQLIQQRINGSLKFLDGLTLLAVTTLNKVVRAAVQHEDHIYTVDNPRFIHGAGMKTI